MSFWKTFGFHTVSAIDTLLDSGEFTLEQLLDEEEILQETKSQNKKLLDFLIEPDTLKKLLYYITVEPREDDDAKRKFKYPFLACEILASEVWAICDAMYQNTALLDELYGYFNKEAPLHPLLSSYTSRVAGVLLQKKVAETIDYMKEKQNIIQNFLKHMGNASIMDLLLKVIACEDSTDGAGTLEWLCTTDLIPSLINKFDPQIAGGASVHENASQALVDIIAVSLNSSSGNPSPLIAQLESEEMIQILYKYMLDQGLSSSLLYGIQVVIELLRRHPHSAYAQQGTDNPVPHDDLTKLEDLSPLFQITVANLGKMKGLLSQKQTTNSDNNNNVSVTKVALPYPAEEFEPLGFHRLKVIEFFAALIACNYTCIDQELIRLDVLSSCLELFLQYPWNNFLHATIESIVNTILDGENEELRIYLLRDAGLLNTIVKASKSNEEECAKPKGVRKGYMGHVTTMSTSIIHLASINPAVEKLLAEHEEWNAYVRGALSATKERESRTLGGYIASGDFNVDEGEDMDEYEENGEVGFDPNNLEGREDYSAEEGNWRMGNQDEDEDFEDDEGVVIQSRIDEGQEGESEEVWEERDIKDVEEVEEVEQDLKHQSIGADVNELPANEVSFFSSKANTASSITPITDVIASGTTTTTTDTTETDNSASSSSSSSSPTKETQDNTTSTTSTTSDMNTSDDNTDNSEAAATTATSTKKEEENTVVASNEKNNEENTTSTTTATASTSNDNNTTKEETASESTNHVEEQKQES